MFEVLPAFLALPACEAFLNLFNRCDEALSSTPSWAGADTTAHSDAWGYSPGTR